MATLRELTYMVLDELKLSSDDSYFNEEHVIFLIGKYRGLILKQIYKDIKSEIPDSNYQTLQLELTKVPAISGVVCECGEFLKTLDKLPSLLTVASPKIYSNGNYTKEITYISRERMRYVGHNKWLKDTIYASLGTDGYIYLTSANKEFLNLESIEITGIFEQPDKVLQGDSSNSMDVEYPLEEGLIPQVIEAVVKTLLIANYDPEDSINNAKDDLSNLATYIAKNTKSALAKKLSE
jgi:hypothetical protein